MSVNEIAPQKVQTESEAGGIGVSAAAGGTVRLSHTSRDARDTGTVVSVPLGGQDVPFAPSVCQEAPSFTAADYERIARAASRRRLYRFVKRAFDVAFSLCVIAVLLIPVLAVALVIYLDDPHGSPFFAQRRVGRHGNEFTMFKLRSMCVDAEEHLAELKGSNEKTGPVFKMRDDPRVTRVGRFIRKASVAPVIIGTPGDGEPAKPLSHPVNSSLDLHKCESRSKPSLVAQTTSFQFLSFAIFGGLGAARGRRRCACGAASLRCLRAVA